MVKVARKKGRQVNVEAGGHGDRDGWLMRLQDVFGTNGADFVVSQLNQFILAAQDDKGSTDETRVNAMLAMVEAMQPANEVQAALAVQMAMTHFATLTVLRRALRVDQIPQFDSAGSMAVKLARTFTQQVEALAKLQRGGEQTVRVVHVHPGAQAIVGNVSAGSALGGPGGGGSHEIRDQPHAKAVEAAPTLGGMHALRREDAQREPVPLTRGEGAAALPDAWRRQG